MSEDALRSALVSCDFPGGPDFTPQQLPCRSSAAHQLSSKQTFTPVSPSFTLSLILSLSGWFYAALMMLIAVIRSSSHESSLWIGPPQEVTLAAGDLFFCSSCLYSVTRLNYNIVSLSARSPAGRIDSRVSYANQES